MPQYKRSQVPIILIFLGAILLIASVILLGCQNVAVTATPLSSSHEETYPEISRVTLLDAKAAYDSGSAIFVDVRTAQVYQDSHIAGSINIPLSELELRISELDRADWIITYCT